ncbi:hypothetical protein MKK75_20160 [Methylobacterium sp. J-030]|uniref:hypothetical protein n=1 Tax=Methylobacterium sp. J-030 TaxID=2836627 RepID=UPI001FBC0F72|nr:hypothetical protein [Methylobacterium sp. J-030]MCJ2071076.1 hypothetical protein [Methylobacterium sp. J-030]
MTTESTTVGDANLRFWVEPGAERAYEVDLSEFAVGGRLEDQSAAGRRHWGGDFSGRPTFAREIAVYYRRTSPSASASRGIRAALRALFRFLDAIEQGDLVQSVADLKDAHGPLLKRRFDAETKNVSAYQIIKTTVDRMRELACARPMFWPARTDVEPKLQDDVDLKGVQRLFNAFKGEARSIKRMFVEGERLAAQGEDPRGLGPRTGRVEPAAWHVRANHAWLIHELTHTRLCSKAEFYAASAQGLHKANDPTTQMFDGPEYLAPGMTERGRQGFVGKLRWFHPSYHDTAVFLWLFLLSTGWNLATAVSLDVTEDRTWFRDHPHEGEFKALHAFKARSGTRVVAMSKETPEWHPFQLVQYMIARTRPLRATLRHRLAEAEAQHAALSSPAVRAEIDRLRAAVRSPWLYHVVNKVGEVNAFSHDDSAKLNDMARLVAEREGLLEEHPSLAMFGTSIARDAWIGHVYAASGQAVIFARLAAQHKDARQLRHYIKRRRFRADSEQMIRKVHDAVFAEIEDGGVVDPTRLRILVQEGKIAPEVAERLADHRHRTRLGMGCLEPRNPPPEVAPDHREGMLCRVQRCTGCPHGIVFTDSLPALARARAELEHIFRQMPFAAWSGSSFDDELQSLEATLKGFDPEAVEAETESWRAKLRSGDIIAHDTYPAY